jgi:hypothetical protein
MLAILAAVFVAAAPQHDTIFTTDGGRLLGTVVEESPQAVVVQLPDGTARRLPPREVNRIEYADGSVTTPNHPAPPPPTYAPAPPARPPAPPPAYAPPPTYGPPPGYAPAPGYAPPPSYAPPPRPAPSALADRRGGMPPILPVYATFGLGGAFPSGDADDSGQTGLPRRMRDHYDSQLDVYLEGGLRLTPHLALALYVDVGVGEPAREVRDIFGCSDSTVDCTSSTTRVGLLLRHTFEPRAYSTPWIAAGTGFEFGSMTIDDEFLGGSEEAYEYAGWEALRLMAGVDLRANPVFGFGLYGGVAFGRYSRFEDAFGDVDIGRQPFHTTVSAGVRFTLFP